MYESYWGLSDSPFKNSVDVRWFHPSPIHDEALARLGFLVEQHRRCGVLQGQPGTGKSILLSVLHREVTNSQRQSVLIDLLGMDSHELLWTLTAQLNQSPDRDTSSWQLWRSIEECMHAAALSKSSIVLLFDNLNESDFETQATIERLQRVGDQYQCRLTIIAATRHDKNGLSQHSLLEQSDLRVELSPLDASSSKSYINGLLLKAGGDVDIFDSESIAAIGENSGGVPREINRLCDLSLLAGMGDNLQTITADVPRSVIAELQPSLRSTSQFSRHGANPILMQNGY